MPDSYDPELNAAIEEARLLLDEQFTKLGQRLQARYEKALETTRREMAASLNQTARRLKQSETPDSWTQALLEGAGKFSERTALFSLAGPNLKLQGLRQGNLFTRSAGPEIPLASAPALAGVIESADTVIAAGTPRELSQTVTDLLGDTLQSRVYLVPILSAHSVVAILYAEEDGGVDVSALELLAALAGGSYSIRPAAPPQPPAELVAITGGSPGKPSSWEDLPKDEQQIHLKAQRFARTEVAGIVLNKGQEVRSGRESRNIYGALREEVDRGREAFRSGFMQKCASMVDYYHLELVRTLAREDRDLLGPDYPGPLLP
jgi:hypothetical protein